jgi:hypothetical protein
MMNPEQKKELYSLLHALAEDTLTDDLFARLDQWLGEDEEARKTYVDFIQILSALQYFQASLDNKGGVLPTVETMVTASDQWTDSAIWAALSEAEKTSPAAEIQKIDEPEKKVVKKLAIERIPRKINKFSLYMTITSVAAFFALLVYVYFAPSSVSQEVATVLDCIDVQLADNQQEFGIGCRLVNHARPIWLKKGIVKIQFDYGAEVIVEGPAEIELESAEKMKMSYGRVFANVPEQAAGFMIHTPYSKVIDLGTAFGVKVDVDGATEVHMFKGKASLIPGASGQSAQGQTLTRNQARHVNITGQTQEIEFQPTAFVRNISSKEGIVWRGENHINVVEIVKGRPGFGTKAQSFYAINHATGQELTDNVTPTPYSTLSRYNRVEKNNYIDGVFVPDGGQGEQVITSAGHVFKECPDTSSEWFSPILTEHVPFVTLLGGIRQKPDINPWILGGQSYGSSKSAMLFHANSGLTLDLLQICKPLSNIRLSAFTATVGISESVPETLIHAAEFWVLVDGRIQCHYSHQGASAGVHSVRVELTEKDRFLTLIATDGGDTINYDWWVVAEPLLVTAED